MQIILLILQLLILATLVIVLRQNEQIKKCIDKLSDSLTDFYAENALFHQRYFGRGTYAVVREWFDTHDCTVRLVEADDIMEAYKKGKDTDEDKCVIVNIFKIK